MTTLDSAGVVMISSLSPRWAEADRWTIEPEPSLVLGPSPEYPDLSFHEVTDVLRLPDGGIAVANSASDEVKLFDPEGRPTGTLGRPGDGPGEFEFPKSMSLNALGEITVFDPTLMRISTFQTDGAFLRLVSIPPFNSRFTSDLLPLLRGYVLTQDRSFGEGAAAEVRRFESPYLRLSESGAVLDSIGFFPGTAVFRTEEASGTAPFGARSHAATIGDTLVVGTGDMPEIRYYSTSGETVRIVRWSASVIPLGNAHRDAYVAALMDLIGVPEADRPGFAKAILDNPFPTHLPVFQDLLVDSTGELWLMHHLEAPAHFPSTWGSLAQRWTVLSREGEWLGEVKMPMGFTPMRIDSVRVLGVHRDGFGVETVREHDVHR